MAKAYALALGDAAKTKALYIVMRVDQLQAEAAASLVEDKKRREIEEVNRKEKEVERLADEKKRKREADDERRRREEMEAQRVGDAWSRSESLSKGYEPPHADKPAEPPKQPATPPGITPEELEKIIASLKQAQRGTGWNFK